MGFLNGFKNPTKKTKKKKGLKKCVKVLLTTGFKMIEYTKTRLKKTTALKGSIK